MTADGASAAVPAAVGAALRGATCRVVTLQQRSRLPHHMDKRVDACKAIPVPVFVHVPLSGLALVSFLLRHYPIHLQSTQYCHNSKAIVSQ